MVHAATDTQRIVAFVTMFQGTGLYHFYVALVPGYSFCELTDEFQVTYLVIFHSASVHTSLSCICMCAAVSVVRPYTTVATDHHLHPGLHDGRYIWWRPVHYLSRLSAQKIPCC